MALELMYPGIQPLGHFDGYDNITTAIRGGEVATIVPVAVGGGDLSAWDQNGTSASTNGTRPAVTILLTSGDRPLYLTDDGLAFYGTAWGSVVGGMVGQQSYALGQFGTQLGPHTALASGKITLWDKPGMYAVTLDAVDTTAATGLTTTNVTLTIGDPLYATSLGRLTPNNALSFETPGAAAPVVARFINFESWKGGSLVTTPIFLVSAANSPVGQGQPQAAAMSRAVFQWSPPIS